MQDTRKKFGCPKCQKIAKVPLEHLGKRIQCPKCSFIFRAGPKPLEESEIIAELDEDEPTPSLPVAAFIDPLPAPVAPTPLAPAPPLATQRPSRPLPSSRPATPYRSKMVKETKRRDEMTEFESNLQSSGVFLLVLPVIATLLPLLGLQLRRLAKLGEFAPIGAMFLGLIGVGMICYARRKQGDAVMLGSAAAVFVLFSGIGGFFMVSALAPSQEDDSSGYFDGFSDRSRERTNTAEEDMAKAKAHHDEVTRKVNEAHEEFSRQQREHSRQMREDSDRMIRQAEENHRRAIENMRSNMPGAPNVPRPNFGPGFGGRRN